MSAERDSDEAIQVAVDIDGDAVEIERERIETVRVDQLFRPVEDGNCDARLQLWSDSTGWNGYERRGDQYYHVNVLTETIVEGTEVTVESEYIHEEAVPAETHTVGGLTFTTYHAENREEAADAAASLLDRLLAMVPTWAWVLSATVLAGVAYTYTRPLWSVASGVIPA
jgi:hypothetical protein